MALGPSRTGRRHAELENQVTNRWGWDRTMPSVHGACLQDIALSLRELVDAVESLRRVTEEQARLVYRMNKKMRRLPARHRKAV